MLQVEMTAAVRTETGKGAMRCLRSEGLSPAVVYGAGNEATALKRDTKTLTANLLGVYRRNCIVTLKIDDGSEKFVTIKEVQADPIQDTLVHADFCEIDLHKARNFEVPLSFTGTAKGVDLGGTLTIYADVVTLKGCPLDIPDECSLDVTALKIGEELSFSAIALPENVELVTKPESVCVGVVK